jgi:hypothetical protein
MGVVEEQGADDDDVPELVIEPNDYYPMPRTPLEVGIRRAVEWYKENPVEETYTHLKKATTDDKST